MSADQAGSQLHTPFRCLSHNSLLRRTHRKKSHDQKPQPPLPSAAVSPLSGSCFSGSGSKTGGGSSPGACEHAEGVFHTSLSTPAMASKPSRRGGESAAIARSQTTCSSVRCTTWPYSAACRVRLRCPVETISGAANTQVLSTDHRPRAPASRGRALRSARAASCAPRRRARSRRACR